MENGFGNLYLVATPIGNLADITLRAIETLKLVDFVISEDSRVSGKLLYHLGIKKQQLVLNDYNETSKLKEVIYTLKQGSNVALVSDAGTPLISDPGFKLVRAAKEENIKVIPIPGPSAVTTALITSGLPTDRFYFAGFPPPKGNKRKEYFERLNLALTQLSATAVVFESPIRIVEFLNELKDIGNLKVFVSRELTKVHEELVEGNAEELIKKYAVQKPKGEITIVLKILKS